MKWLRALRVVSFSEGLSFLILLGVAMPLKYLADVPIAVRVAGSLHGVLFLALLPVLYKARSERAWSIGVALWIFGLALVPFGFVFIDRRLVRELRAVD